jgi:hypothetical protein
VNLVGKVGETDEAHEFLANHGGRGVWGRDERGIGWAGVAILREGVAVAARIVGHLSEGAWGEEMDDEKREGRWDECVAGC